MTALTGDVNRAISGGIPVRLALAASTICFQGSLLTYDANGYAVRLSAGAPFAGIARERVIAADWIKSTPADGDIYAEALQGKFLLKVSLSGVGIVDVRRRRKVYASDDATFTFTPTGNTYIGVVVGYEASNVAVIECQTAERIVGGGYCPLGVETLADAAATLTVAQLDKLLVITPTAGRTLTLPPAAHCTGRCFTVKTLAAQVVTLDGDAAETIDGAATNVLCDAANDVLTIMSDGTKWLSVCGKIA